MFKKPSAKQYKILAVIWALAAAAMAVTVVRRLPALNPLYLLLLLVSLFVASSSWRSWKLYRKAEEDAKLEQYRKAHSMDEDQMEEDLMTDPVQPEDEEAFTEHMLQDIQNVEDENND